MSGFDADGYCLGASRRLFGPRAHRAFNVHWLWLNRDGSPTEPTGGVFEKLLGANATPEQRFDIAAYMLAGVTEFWRAHRAYAGILHFVYLAASYPGVYTSDSFLDIKSLKLEPHFEDYMGEAFKPLGVYIDFWQPMLAADSTRRFLVMTINDDAAPMEGKLVISLESPGCRPATPTVSRRRVTIK